MSSPKKNNGKVLTGLMSNIYMHLLSNIGFYALIE